MSSKKEIARYYDEYGPIQILDDGNKRYLAFGGGDEQSCQLQASPFQLQHDYTQTMLLVLLFKQPASLTLLGLGGGCLATTLHHYIPDLKMNVVELRPLVAKAAHRFFHFPRSERINVFLEDACEYLERPELELTDIIFGDLYDADGLDIQQTQPWFIEHCYHLLNDDGWLVLNCWQSHRAEREMLETLRLHFAEVKACITAEGNWVVFASKKVIQTSATQLRVSAKYWSKELGYSMLSKYDRLKALS